MATRTAEQYLKLILALEGRQESVLSELARQLGVTPASVTGMIKRLVKQGLLLHVSYGGVELTASGREIAVRLLRRHRIAESYLSARLDYPLHLLHDEADALEHHMSSYLEERMYEALDHPSYDPHGHPIPDAGGVLPDVDAASLADAPEGSEGLVASVPDRDTLFLRHLVELECVPGKPYRVLRRDDDNGVLYVGFASREEGLSLSHARDILVCERDTHEESCLARELFSSSQLGILS